MVDLHRVVSAQIVGAKKNILNVYAEIYYNAWKASTDMKEYEKTRERG